MHLLLRVPPKSLTPTAFASTARILGRPPFRCYVEHDRKAADVSPSKKYDGPLVISGISGRFPQCSSVKDLTSKLLQSQELTSATSTRWLDKRLPKRFGFLSDLDKFDASFFGMTPYQAHQMDPQIRLLLEVATEAVMDAGLNPEELRSSRTAVFSGAYGGEPLFYFQMRPNPSAAAYQYTSHGFMIPGRLAFHLDLCGPSAHVSTACSSSLTALHSAVLCIQSGQCDAALVTGSTIHLLPTSHLHLMALDALAMDGRCKTFDESGDGFCRSEAAVAVVIQKEEDALRNYASILSIRAGTDGYKDAGILHPRSESQEKLLRECYAEAGVDPANVSYVEAHGTGTPSGDPEELRAIYNVFCKTRGHDHPLQVGSVKTNMGHAEGAAGLCGLSKVIGAIQTGLIPPNLHFQKPRHEIADFFDGTLKVVTETTKFDGGIAGVSSFGIGGTNYHVVLQPGPCHNIEPNVDLPVLLPLSGRSEGQVRHSLEQASEAAGNPEFVHLVQKAYRRHIPGHSYRGVALVQPTKTNGDIAVKWCETTNRPVWVVFPGMGSQYNEMGKALMKLSAFSESIGHSRATLKNLGLDLDHLLAAGNDSIYTDIQHAFVAITAIQIALWDTLSCLAIKPEGFVGHSFGELMCAYADGCLSSEETLLLADARGKAFKESRKVIGGMASIAMTAQDIQSRLPQNVELACFNTAKNVTISGELEAITKFVDEIKNEGTMATMVNSCGFAAHSHFVQDAADLFKSYMTDIVVDRRLRSPRWISTSFLESATDCTVGKYCSAEYFGCNVRNPVYFYQAAQHIPSGAVVIEVSPKGFFKALLSQTIPKDCIHVAPMASKAEDKLEHFFQSVGELYLSGIDLQIDKLYAPVPTPASSNTPSLSHLVQWDHSKSWKTSILDYPMGHKYERIINLDNVNQIYLKGHRIEDRILLPATNILESVWIQYADMLGACFEALAVQFTDVSFKRATILNENSDTVLLYSVNTNTGAFEVENQGEIVASGTIALLPEDFKWPDIPVVESSPYMPLNKDDVYKAFRLRGYIYTDLFQGIEKIDNEGRWAEVAWRGNWTTFLDTVLQTAILTSVSDHLIVPVGIQQITIDPLEFKKNMQQASSSKGQEELVHVINVPTLSTILTRGVEIKSMSTATVPKKLQTSNLVYESYTFCPLIEKSNRNLGYHFHEFVDLVLENHPSSLPLNVVDIFTKKENSRAVTFEQISSVKPSKKSQVRMLTLNDQAVQMDKKNMGERFVESKATKEELLADNLVDLVLLDDPSLLPGIGAKIKENSFVILHSTQERLEPLKHFSIVSHKTFPESTMSLLRKTSEAIEDVVHISVDEDEFTWLSNLQKAICSSLSGKNARTKIYITSQGTPNSGILGLMRCLRMEEEEWNVRCIFDPEKKLVLDFNQPDSRLASILKADLGLNVWQDDQHGTYRHINFEENALAIEEQVQDAYVGTLTPGDLSSLSWIQLPSMNWAKDEELKGNSYKKPYHVVCSALNFRDVLLATGAIPLLPEYSYKGQYLGFEFSGFDEQGNRVMGISRGNCLASYFFADPRLVWSVPSHWTLEQAATVPIVYTTVLHAFYTRARIQPGQTILIHAGSGGVGQAAIRVALANGCKVFTTVGSVEKREFIKKMFPQLTDEQIGCSRDTSFESQFMEVTSGRGVDVILNSLAGDKLQASLRCLAISGKFLEIGVFDAYMNTKIGMRPFLNGIEIIGIELQKIMSQTQQGAGQHQLFRKLMEDAIQNEDVIPLPAHSFSKNEIEQAFRFMANGKHMGKLVIKLKEENSWNEPLNVSAIKRSYFDPNKNYLVVGGLGGLGLELVSWLIERGARRIIVTSRSGVTKGYQAYCTRKWLVAGADVRVVNIDLSVVNLAEDFIVNLSKERKFGGIFNAALVLEDKPFLKQTVESFQHVAHPKESVTNNLDKVSRKYELQLDYFVCFSSFTCGRGSFEQTNYGWSNSAVERICESRVRDGLHGLTIQYGVIGKVGLVSETMRGKELEANFELLGVKSQSVESCLHVLDAAMQQDIPVVSSLVVAEKGGATEERIGFVSQVQKIFGIDNLQSVAKHKKLSELGMDSLIAIEMRQALEREFKITVTKENLRRLTVGNIISISEGTFDVKTIGKVFVGKEVAEDDRSWKIHDEPLRQLSLLQSDRKVYIVHGSDGGCSQFDPLANKLKASVYGFQFTGKPERASVPELAKYYVQKMKEIQPQGPYTIMGYSLGAAIAYNMAQQLVKKRELVQNLVFLDGCPSYSGITTEAKTWFMLLTIQSLNTARDFPEDQLRALVNRLNGDVDHDVMQIFNSIKFPTEFDQNSAKMYVHHVYSVTSYEPAQNYDGDVVLLEASVPSTYTKVLPSKDYDVRKFCSGSVTHHRVTGSHWSYFEETNIADKANIINDLIS